MTGRKEQTTQMKELLKLHKSYFVAVTGRRRVGKTFLIDQVYEKHMCLRVTGIQDGDMSSQIYNFTQKIAEYSNIPIVTPPEDWQQVFSLLKKYLQSLSTKKKHVIFLDELPWMSTPRSRFIQLLAHLWNDYLSKHKNFILVICGSATSWITKKILNDKGGFHNRVTHTIRLQPFTLSETKAFLKSKRIHLTDSGIVELYMTLGGIPYYLENIKRGESPSAAIDRMCFTDDGILRYEYDNLYRSLFDYPQNHEAIVKALATSRSGLTRQELLKKSKVESGGPYTRAMEDLVLSNFVIESNPYGKKKRGSIYRLVDEYSVFYHKFIRPNRKSGSGIWTILSQSAQYHIWTGYAFETLCLKHIKELKKALRISKVYTEESSFKMTGKTNKSGVQIDLIIDRADKAINICECKFHAASFKIDKKYAAQLENRKIIFQEHTRTRKQVFTTMITNHPITKNEYLNQVVDKSINISSLMK